MCVQRAEYSDREIADNLFGTYGTRNVSAASQMAACSQGLYVLQQHMGGPATGPYGIARVTVNARCPRCCCWVYPC